MNFKTVNKIVKEVKPYQLTIIVNDAAALNRKVFKDGTMNQIPAVMIDLQDMEITNDNRSLSMPFFLNPRQTSVYFIIIKRTSPDFQVDKIFDLMHDLVQISPKQPRPKSLLILLDQWSKKESKVILKYAWSLKFLDFTILKQNESNRTVFINYNPFTKRYLESTKKVFPDKLIDVKKYPLTFPVFNLAPYVTIGRDNNTSGIQFDYIKLITEAMGFSENLVMERHYNTEELFENIFKKTGEK